MDIIARSCQAKTWSLFWILHMGAGIQALGHFQIALAGSWIRSEIARYQMVAHMEFQYGRLYLLCKSINPPDLLLLAEKEIMSSVKGFLAAQSTPILTWVLTLENTVKCKRDYKPSPNEISLP